MIFISNKKEKKKKNLPLVRKTYEETKTRSEHNLLNSFFFFVFFFQKKSAWRKTTHYEDAAINVTAGFTLQPCSSTYVHNYRMITGEASPVDRFRAHCEKTGRVERISNEVFASFFFCSHPCRLYEEILTLTTALKRLLGSHRKDLWNQHNHPMHSSISLSQMGQSECIKRRDIFIYIYIYRTSALQARLLYKYRLFRKPSWCRCPCF